MSGTIASTGTTAASEGRGRRRYTGYVGLGSPVVTEQVPRGNAGTIGPEAANRGRGIAKPEKHTKRAAGPRNSLFFSYTKNINSTVWTRMKARLGRTSTRRYVWLPYAHHDFETNLSPVVNRTSDII